MAERNGNPHIPESLQDDPEIAIPTGSIELVWFINDRGEQAYAYSLKGVLHYNECIGTLTRLIHHLVKQSEEDEDG